MTYCTCGHADILHVDHFLNGRLECAVDGCTCDYFVETRRRP